MIAFDPTSPTVPRRGVLRVYVDGVLVAIVLDALGGTDDSYYVNTGTRTSMNEGAYSALEKPPYLPVVKDLPWLPEEPWNDARVDRVSFLRPITRSPSRSVLAVPNRFGTGRPRWTAKPRRPIRSRRKIRTWERSAP